MRLDLRNSLYNLFQVSLSDPKQAESFDWLLLFTEECRKQDVFRHKFTDIVSAGKSKKNLNREVFTHLLSTTKIIKILSEGTFPVHHIEEEIDLQLESNECSYIEDRVKRFMNVLSRIPTSKGNQDILIQDLVIAESLFNNGLFFDCHEFLETTWKQAQEPEKSMVQGLIQASAGFHKLELGSSIGCVELLGNAVDKLKQYPHDHKNSLKVFIEGLLKARKAVEEKKFNFDQVPNMAITIV